jgi:hypothetical protein
MPNSKATKDMMYDIDAQIIELTETIAKTYSAVEDEDGDAIAMLFYARQLISMGALVAYKESDFGHEEHTILRVAQFTVSAMTDMMEKITGIGIGFELGSMVDDSTEGAREKDAAEYVRRFLDEMTGGGKH